MSETPNISVLIPVHNGESSIGQAIWSILNQDHQDLELLVYLDGCRDNTLGIIEGIHDERLKYFVGEENKGIVFARNFLIDKAQGKYLAWLDADDLALPERLKKQFNFLEENPELHILGTWCEVRNSKEISAVKWPADPAMLQAWMLFRNPLVQSSVMCRKAIHNSPLLKEFEYLEDYEFYCRYIDKPVFGLLPEMLCSYYNPGNTELLSKHRDYAFHKKSQALLRNNLEQLNIMIGQHELEIFHRFLRTGDDPGKDNAGIVFRMLLMVKKANQAKEIFSEKALNKVIQFQLLRLLKLSKGFRPTVLKQLLSNPVAMLRALGAGPAFK
jgi:glycosyltransferase involved in cell wall biosynthesis